MWSDELDNKMKEATEGYHPAYDDKAWDKMELLLDKHLPQEKKRRRFILLLLPLLLVGTGIFLIIQKRGKDGITEEKNTIVKPVSEKEQVEPEKNVTVATGATGTKAAVLPGPPGTIAPVSEPATGKKSIAETTLKKQITNRAGSFSSNKKAKQVVLRGQELKPQTSSVLVEDNSDPIGQGNSIIANQPSEQTTNIAATDKDNVNNSILPVPIDSAASLTQVAKSADEKKQPDSSENKDELTEEKPQKQKNSPGSKLSINFSAGPDISSVGVDNPGKWNLQYGIGLSYAVSKRVSIRTGFFAGRKKYSADSTEYYSSYYPPKLERIDANCLVYEIPVNLVYSFPAVKKHNWFIAGGLSSYLMKKETYGYYYKNAWGQPQYYSRTYKNENSHLFSVINISGGYQYHFTDRLSLLAEPYVRIPVSGIGSGKVKLNSGGVLFTLGFKPFLKRN
jgi:hypothetical protein